MSRTLGTCTLGTCTNGTGTWLWHLYFWHLYWLYGSGIGSGICMGSGTCTGTMALALALTLALALAHALALALSSLALWLWHYGSGICTMALYGSGIGSFGTSARLFSFHTRVSDIRCCRRFITRILDCCLHDMRGCNLRADNIVTFFPHP